MFIVLLIKTMIIFETISIYELRNEDLFLFIFLKIFLSHLRMDFGHHFNINRHCGNYE